MSIDIGGSLGVLCIARGAVDPATFRLTPGRDGMAIERSMIAMPELNDGVPSSEPLPSARVTLGSRPVDRPKDSEQGIPRLASSASHRKQKHPQVRVVVINKSEILRAGLRHVLSGDRFCVEGYSTLDELSRTAVNNPPCILLISLDNDEVDFPLFHIGKLKARHGISHIVALSETFSREDLLCAIEARVDAYLINNESTTETLEKALELVLLGASVFPQDSDRMLKGDVTPNGGGEPLAQAAPRGVQPHAANCGALSAIDPRLSDREQAILTHLARGASNKHIALELNIAEATVKVHVKSILRKLRVQNRTQAAMVAMNFSFLP